MLENFAASANRALERLLDLFGPPSCAACGGPRRDGGIFCSACGAPARVASRALDGVPLVVAGAYEPPLAPAIRRFKFEGRSELARGLARLLSERLAALSPNSAVFVPVPLHRARLVERGYNQSALLARALASTHGGRVDASALERLRATEQQARLGQRARLANVEQAFRARRPLAHAKVVLVDDVVTTGATARACLLALKDAGADVLAVAALARADGPG